MTNSLIIATAVLLVLGIVVILIGTGLLRDFLAPVQASNMETVIRNCCGDRSKWDCDTATAATVMCRKPNGEIDNLQQLAVDAGLSDEQLCRLCFCTDC